MDDNRDRPEDAPAPQPRPAAPAAPASLSSRDLLQGRAEVEIRHGEEVYRLRRTRGGKLILTK